MNKNPMFKILAILIGVGLLVAFVTFVLPAMAALVIVGVAIVGLLTFSGWIVRMIKGESYISASSNSTQDYNTSNSAYARPTKNEASWKRVGVEDAQIIDQEKRE